MPMINLGWMKCLQQDPCKVSTRKVRVREKLNDSARHNNYMYDYDSIDWIERSRLQLAPVQTNSSQSTMPLKFSIFQRFRHARAGILQEIEIVVCRLRSVFFWAVSREAGQNCIGMRQCGWSHSPSFEQSCLDAPQP
jgi:hypothetical protein